MKPAGSPSRARVAAGGADLPDAAAGGPGERRAAPDGTGHVIPTGYAGCGGSRLPPPAAAVAS